MRVRRRLSICGLVCIPLLLASMFGPSGQWLRQSAPLTVRSAYAAAASENRMIQRRLGIGVQGQPTNVVSHAPVQAVYFTPTGHQLSDASGFLSFWRSHGGLMIFGYPISEEIVEDGQVRQYFERARFEYHPDEPNPQYRVQLSILAHELWVGRDFAPVPPGSGELFFSETNHSISGAFYDFWIKRGGAQIFGLPISEPLQEVNPLDGQPYTVQYFERARFEHHPEDLEPFYRDWAQSYSLRLHSLYEVRLSDLGRQVATQRGDNFGRTAQPEGIPEWSSTLWARRIDVNLSTQQLIAYEDDLPVFHAPVATGKDGFNTPTGTFSIYERRERETMAGAWGGESWYVPNIPWSQYVVGEVALHGTYWHDEWGTGFRLSHGCINLNIDDAQWLYAWADIGTQVNISY